MNFRGVSLDQDARFTNKDTKLRNSIAWPPIFSQRVQLRHVNMSAMRPWIQRRLSELAGYEDEILINYAIEMLENAIQNCETGVVPSTSSSSVSSTVSSSDVVMDPREMQVNLTAFTDQEKAYRFMEELWTLLVSASQTPSGIPEPFLEEERQRVLEMRKQQEQIRSQIEMRKSQSSGGSSGSNRRQMFGGRINDGGGGDDKRQMTRHSAEQHVQSLDHHRHHHTHHIQSRRRDNTQLEGHRFVNRRNVSGHENHEYRRDGEDNGHGREYGEKRPREESNDRSTRTDIREEQQSYHVHREKRARVDSDASTHDESHRSSKRPKIETTESVSGGSGGSNNERNVPTKPTIEKHGDQSKQSRSGSRSSSSDDSSDGDDGSSESSNNAYIRRRRSLRDGEGDQRSRPASPSKLRSSSSSRRREYGDDDKDDGDKRGDDRRMEHDDRRTRTRNERDYDRSYDDRYRHSSRDQRSSRRRDGDDEEGRDRDRDYHYGSRYAQSRSRGSRSSGKSYHRDRSRDEYSRSRRQLSSSPPRPSPDRYGDSYQRKFDRDRESGSLRYMERPAKSELKPRKSPLDATNSPPPASPPPLPPSLPQPASKSITDLAGKLRESMVKKEQPEQEPSN